MNLEKIKSFIQLAKEQGVGALKYEEKDFKISVDLGARAPAPPQISTIDTTSAKTSNPDVGANYHEVKSPFVGTFYRSSAPGKPAFVSEGEKVKKGQVLCILEAMKIMNEIDCDVNGEIVEICVENESLVEFGQTLFKIKT